MSDELLALQSGAHESSAPLCRSNIPSDPQHGPVPNDAQDIGFDLTVTL